MTIPAFITVTALTTTAQAVERSRPAIVGLDHLIAVVVEESSTGAERCSVITLCTGEILRVRESVDEILTAIRSLEEPRVTIQTNFSGGGGGN